MPQPNYEDLKEGVGDDQLIMGIQNIDLEELQGIPQGSLIALVAPAYTQDESLLYHLTYTRPTGYVTTLQRRENIKRNLDEMYGEPDDYEIYDATEEEPDRCLMDATDHMRQAEGPANVIFDSFTEDELSLQDVNNLKDKINRNDSLGIIRFNSHYENLSKVEKKMVNICDGVFVIDPHLNPNQLMHSLHVTKLLGKTLEEREIDIEFNREVSIDTRDAH